MSPKEENKEYFAGGAELYPKKSIWAASKAIQGVIRLYKDRVVFSPTKGMEALRKLSAVYIGLFHSVPGALGYAAATKKGRTSRASSDGSITFYLDEIVSLKTDEQKAITHTKEWLTIEVPDSEFYFIVYEKTVSNQMLGLFTSGT